MKNALFAFFGMLAMAGQAAVPKPLADGAVTSDWPRFLGPAHNAISPETGLLKKWEKEEPKRLWEFLKGSGHASPAISGKSLVVFHRLETRETIDCLESETGRPLWNFSYEAPYQDRYGSGDGPKTNPLIDDGRVFTFGISGHLHCLNLSDGRVLWKRDLSTDYQMKPNFFGHGSTPLVIGSRLIVNIGGKENACVAAFDTATGKQLWIARHEWGASYASPVPATFYNRECVLVFAGGESRPATGGLLCIDAATGEVLNATPHRARIAESVSASSPVVVGNRVFITESYGSGGEMVEIAPDFSARSVWKTAKFGAYFMTPVAREGYLYGSSGQQPRLAELVCYEAATGREMWRDDLGGRFQRSTLLCVDGAFLCLGENGLLAWLDLSPKGATVLASKQLFNAPESWTLPALSRGLLYISQNASDDAGNGPRLICYDLRAQ